MVYKVGVLKACMGFACISFFAALGGCNSDGSQSATSTNASVPVRRIPALRLYYEHRTFGGAFYEGSLF